MKRISISLLFLLASTSQYAQSSSQPGDSGNFYARFEARTNAIQSKQPAWAVPLVTTYTGLFQVVRMDALRQITPTHTDTWNIDNSKGVNIIPWNRTEFAFDLPAFIEHNSKAKDGWGDMSFLGKVRLASGNEQHGAYNVVVFVQATVPSGNYKNGSTDATVTPSIGVGKGFGRFDIQTAAGETIATSKPASTTLGKPVAWNAVAQYRIGKHLWPELESNATFYRGGTNNGKIQEFLTPGLLMGRFKLHPEDTRSRPALMFGGGMQIASSHFHSYNHSLILTARWIY